MERPLMVVSWGCREFFVLLASRYFFVAHPQKRIRTPERRGELLIHVPGKGTRLNYGK